MVKIGLECHVELTEGIKTKIFCGCLNKGNDTPNTRTCPTCLGLPGAKPNFNKAVLKIALKIACALNFKINEEMYFSRKTYFYPDLPSSFQITQYEIPLGTQGIFENITLRRIHMEEDPGKLIHEGNQVLIDYNRSGTPLVEIVTEPEFTSPEHVREFLRKIITVLEYLGAYNRKSESSLRVDANISTTGARVEIKNIGSIKDIEKALKSEIERQKKHVPQEQETRRWDPELQTSTTTRTKETEEDYGYIFEANLPKITISKEEIEEVKKTLPELADRKIQRFMQEYAMKPEDAEVITADHNLAHLFEKVAKKIDHKLATRWFVREIPKILNYNKITLEEWKITEKDIIELLELLQENKITETTAQKVLEKLSQTMFSPKEYITKEKLTIVSSSKDLEEIAKKIIKEHQKAVQDYKNGEEKSFNFLVGQIMKQTRGTAAPSVVQNILKKLLKN